MRVESSTPVAPARRCTTLQKSPSPRAEPDQTQLVVGVDCTRFRAAFTLTTRAISLHAWLIGSTTDEQQHGKVGQQNPDVFYLGGYCRAPKMVDPTRILLLPISIACSKSPDMPMLSSSDASGTPSAAATFCRQSARQAKFSGRDE